MERSVSGEQNLDVDLTSSNARKCINLCQSFFSTPLSKIRFAAVRGPPFTVLERNLRNYVDRCEKLTSTNIQPIKYKVLIEIF